MAVDLLAKVDLRQIVAEHWGTLVDVRVTDGRKKTGDFLLFYGTPFLFVVAMLWFNIRVSDVAIDALATAASLIAGLLFNLLVLLHQLDWPKRGEPVDSTVDKLKHQLHANIAYSIFIAVVTLIPLVVAANYDSKDFGRALAGYVASYLATHFTLTMGMVLKRMDAMLQFRLTNS